MKQPGLLFFLLLAIFPKISAQVYTAKKYAFSISRNLVYGVDTAFDGKLDTLKLDLYKPANDSNCLRPIMVVIHGGAWLAGDKGDGEMVNLCSEFAARGYLVASVNYRMGMHPASYYVPYAICPHAKCSYVADSAEYYRACYRAAQDIKGAVRFLKNRSAQDSSDNKNVYLLGESAGAFTANHAAFTDRNAEKPIQCFVLADAPTPDSDLSSCVSGAVSRKRPDLGSIQGKLNLQGADARVQGVASLFGGVLDMSIWKNSDPADTPDQYFYHQTCDVVVDHNTGKIFWKVFYYCYDPVNLCMPFSSGPVSYGSSSIKKYLDTTSLPHGKLKYTLLTDKGAYSCNAGDNCHGIDNLANRCAEIAQFFSNRIASSGNQQGSGNCLLSAPTKTAVHTGWYVYPNPAADKIYIRINDNFASGEIKLAVLNLNGTEILKSTLANNQVDASISLPKNLAAGVYWICLSSENMRQCTRMVKIETE